MKARYIKYMENVIPSNEFLSALESGMTNRLFKKKASVGIKAACSLAAAVAISLTLYIVIYGLPARKDNVSPVTMATAKPDTAISVQDDTVKTISKLSASNGFFIAAGTVTENDIRHTIVRAWNPETLAILSYTGTGEDDVYRSAAVIDDNTIAAIRLEATTEKYSIDIIRDNSIEASIGITGNAFSIYAADNVIFLDSAPESGKARLSAYDVTGSILFEIDMPYKTRINGVVKDGESFVCYGYVNDDDNGAAVAMRIDGDGNVLWEYSESETWAFVGALMTDEGSVILLGNDRANGESSLTKLDSGIAEWKRQYCDSQITDVEKGTATTQEPTSIAEYKDGYIISLRLNYPKENYVMLRYVDTNGDTVSEWAEGFPEITWCQDSLTVKRGDKTYVAVYCKSAEADTLTDWDEYELISNKTLADIDTIVEYREIIEPK